MKRKWLLIVITVMLLSIGLVYYQIPKMAHYITQRLASDYNIKLKPESLSFSYFPLTIHAEEVHYHKNGWMFSAEELKLILNYWGWISGKNWIKQLEVENGSIYKDDEAYLTHISAVVKQISQTSVLSAKVEFSKAENRYFQHLKGQFYFQLGEHKYLVKQLNVDWQWLHKIGEMKSTKLQVDEALVDGNVGEAKATEIILNKLKLPRIQMNFKAKNQFDWQFVFAPNAQILLTQKNDDQLRNKWHFVGENVPLEPITTLLGYQPLIESSFDFNGEIATVAEQKQQVHFHFESVNGGKIKGFNVVNLLESSLPFSLTNPDRSLQDSKFNKLSGSLVGDSSLIQLHHIELDLPAVNLSGQGNVYPQSSQCEWKFDLQPHQQKYQQYQIGIDLNGDCSSPRYRIRLDDILKEKVKSKLQKLLEKL
ncbi:hypothetical protein [Gallibacterium genomosp. 1]|uniref:Assembly protein n=1 Tax=Gallibacterium genomosp. 1 TaxID=155515 RepID=A0AB36DWJ5_9PAST|nr:hypothetical protein [Gallibacterium genomosp. 1]OBX01471.1 hypothetical protein QV05_05380 [Gallibacterium genomosp. 1]OBX02671.1 hypothetical protein QV04_03565 [Gallibacterium genomosp. 1]